MSEPIILVMDDGPSIGKVVSIYSQRAGYRVIVASDGQSALEALDRQPPDLVVLDLMLPKVDGLEIMRRLRAQGDTPIMRDGERASLAGAPGRPGPRRPHLGRKPAGRRGTLLLYSARHTL